MISLGYLLFITLIPITISIEHKIKFVFLNGYNIVRCGENQVQVYTSPDATDQSFPDLITCDNKGDSFAFPVAGFLWKELNIVCTGAGDQVYEVQFVSRKFHAVHGLDILPDARGVLAGSNQPYTLHIENKDQDDYGNYFAIESTYQIATEDFFQGANKRRTIYVQFPGHPVICRIQFFGEKNKPCSSKAVEDPVDSDYVCYYNPGATVEPTIYELEREFRQTLNAGAESESDTNVFNIEKPVVSSTDLSNSPENIMPNILPKDHPVKKRLTASRLSKGQKKSSVPTIVGITLGILLLFAVIGGVGFYFISKNRSNQSLVAKHTSAVSIEVGNHRGSAETSSDQSEAPSADDSNNEISTDDRSSKENSTVERQTSGKKKQPGANMTFNDDL